MAKDKGSERYQASSPDSSSGEGIRVTDRRRISLATEENGEAGGPSGEAARDWQSNLKPTYVQELEARTQAAEQKAAEVQSRFEQVRAQLRRETDETRQRLNRAADERARAEKANFIAALLPVADNLRRAVEASEQGGSFEALLNGVRGTSDSFENALAAAGAEPVTSVGAQFDPEMHEAVDTVEVAPQSDGVVTKEYSRGYRIGERLLRPARVQVGRALSQAKKAAE